MPRPIFEDSQPVTEGVSYCDLIIGGVFLENPSDPIKRSWKKTDRIIVGRYLATREADGFTSAFAEDATVYPVPIKMVRADSPGCDATKQIVEDARALRVELKKVKEDRDCWRKQSYENGRKFGAETNARVDLRSRLFKLSAEYDQFKAELEDARKVAAVSERYATAFQDDLKAAKTELAQVSDARNVWMGAAQDHKADADKLRAELAKVKTERGVWHDEYNRAASERNKLDEELEETKAELARTAKNACGYMESLDRAIANRNDYCDRAKKAEAELQKAKTSKEEAERRVRAVSTDLGWMTLARNNWMAAHDRAADERDAWKARSEAYSKSVIRERKTIGYELAGRDGPWFFEREFAIRVYEETHNIPPAPTTTDPEQVTQEKKGGGL